MPWALLPLPKSLMTADLAAVVDTPHTAKLWQHPALALFKLTGLVLFFPHHKGKRQSRPCGRMHLLLRLRRKWPSGWRRRCLQCLSAQTRIPWWTFQTPQPPQTPKRRSWIGSWAEMQPLPSPVKSCWLPRQISACPPHQRHGPAQLFMRQTRQVFSHICSRGVGCRYKVKVGSRLWVTQHISWTGRVIFLMLTDRASILPTEAGRSTKENGNRQFWGTVLGLLSDMSTTSARKQFCCLSWITKNKNKKLFSFFSFFSLLATTKCNWMLKLKSESSKIIVCLCVWKWSVYHTVYVNLKKKKLKGK